MSIRPCMGGFCSRRGHCPHHERPTNTVDPSERLCDPGEDGIVEGRMLGFMREHVSTRPVFPSQVLSS